MLYWIIKNNVKYQNLPLEIVKENTVNIKYVDKEKKRKTEKIKNNIFKKFKV